MSRLYEKTSVCKRAFFITVLTTWCTSIAIADNYMPFVQEGKTWYFENSDGSTYSYFLEGDTVIAEKTYKKVFYQEGGDCSYLCSVREDSMIVYTVPQLSEKEEVLGFYRLPAEEHYKFAEHISFDSWIYFDASLLCHVIASTGRLHKLYAATTTITDGDKSIYGSAGWYEGVGNVMDGDLLFSLHQTYHLGHFLRCEMDDTVIFTKDDLFNFVFDTHLTLPKGKPSTSARNAPLYDLQGRQLSNSKWSNDRMRKGVYIQNGRKVVR